MTTSISLNEEEMAVLLAFHKEKIAAFDEQIQQLIEKRTAREQRHGDLAALHENTVPTGEHDTAAESPVTGIAENHTPGENGMAFESAVIAAHDHGAEEPAQDAAEESHEEEHGRAEEAHEETAPVSEHHEHAEAAGEEEPEHAGEVHEEVTAETEEHDHTEEAHEEITAEGEEHEHAAALVHNGHDAGAEPHEEAVTGEDHHEDALTEEESEGHQHHTEVPEETIAAHDHQEEEDAPATETEPEEIIHMVIGASAHQASGYEHQPGY